MDKNELLGELGKVRLLDIEIGTRHRRTYNNIPELVCSIKEKGLIHPIAVVKQEVEGHPPYILAAGGRRMAACLLLAQQGELDEISCRIYPKPLTSRQLRAIELAENVDRDDMEFMDKCRLMKEIDDLWKSELGEKTSTSSDAEGHSLRDTATLMNKSIGAVSMGISLAKACEQFPQLELEKCKTQQEAIKKLETFRKMIVHSQMAKEADSQMGGDIQKLTQSYIVSDVFEGMSKLPSASFDLIELDPPFGIDLQAVKKSDLGYEATYGDAYTEVDQLDYKSFFKRVASECYRLAGANAWIICWYAPEPWAEFVFSELISAGFDGRRLPGLWIKPNGQLHNPRLHLANASEYFYYCRKGDPQIVRQGHTNLFPHSPVSPANKIHPTERPAELMADILSTFGNPGSRVLVPFAGSGVTLRVAFDLKMFAIGFDRSQIYKDAFVAQVMKGGNKG